MNLKSIAAIVGAISLLGGTQAFAGIAIDPQCAHMAHKVSCTCAMQNGGHISAAHGQMMWFMAPHTQDPVGKCVTAAGGETAY
jgi:hypothetical protein